MIEVVVKDGLDIILRYRLGSINFPERSSLTKLSRGGGDLDSVIPILCGCMALTSMHDFDAWQMVRFKGSSSMQLWHHTWPFVPSPLLILLSSSPFFLALGPHRSLTQYFKVP